LILFLAASSLAVAAPQSAACPADQTSQALICRALEAKAGGDAAGAAQAFEQAAGAAPAGDLTAPRLLVAAGNMWLAASQPGKATLDLDKGLAMKGLEAEQRGEALLDRARAAEAQDDLKTARAKLNEAGQTISGDPFYWYFSAALSLRESDGAAAEAAINKALSLAPGDPTLLFEAGHVADFNGNAQKARDYWLRAQSGDNPDVRRAAAKAIELLGVTPVVKLDPIPSK
jgi:tetratricopeptide (TPR) repeat protein